MRAKRSICYRQGETCGVLFRRLRPITILLRQARNLFTLHYKNYISLEIKRRLTHANRCCYDLNGQLSNRGLFRTTKIILYKTLILLELIYGAEAWTLLSTDVAALRIFERKVLRKIFGPVRVGDYFRIRYNSELYELLNDMDVVLRSNIHVVCMEENDPSRRMDLVSVEKTKSRKRYHRLV